MKVAQVPVSCEDCISYAGYRSQWGRNSFSTFTQLPKSGRFSTQMGTGLRAMVGVQGWTSSEPGVERAATGERTAITTITNERTREK
jgi:hypothetical protein